MMPWTSGVGMVRFRVWLRRRDPRRDREAAGKTQRRGIGDLRIRAQRQNLALAGVLGVGRRVDRFLFDARSFRVRVAMNEAHDVGAIRGAWLLTMNLMVSPGCTLRWSA